MFFLNYYFQSYPAWQVFVQGHYAALSFHPNILCATKLPIVVNHRGSLL